MYSSGGQSSPPEVSSDDMQSPTDMPNWTSQDEMVSMPSPSKTITKTILKNENNNAKTMTCYKRVKKYQMHAVEIYYEL